MKLFLLLVFIMAGNCFAGAIQVGDISYGGGDDHYSSPTVPPGGMDFALCEPAVLDLDKKDNGEKQMILPTIGGQVWLFESNGAGIVKGKWPVRLKGEFASPPAVIDHGNGRISIGVLGMKGRFYILDQDGNVTWSTDTGNRNGSVLSTGDYDDDGKLDFAFGTPAGKVYIADSERGGMKKVHPLQSPVSTNILSLDWDEDGKKETVVKGDDGKLYFFSSSGSPIKKWVPKGLPEGKTFDLMYVKDPEGDSSSSLIYRLKPKNNCNKTFIVRVKQDGTFDIPIRHELKTISNTLFEDFDGDGKLDMLVTDKDFRIHVFRSLNQKEMDGFPSYYEEMKTLRGNIKVADLDRDGVKDIVFSYSKEDPDSGETFYYVTAYSIEKGLIAGYPQVVPYNNAEMLINDVDGQGKIELIMAGPPDSPSMGNMPNMIILQTAAHVPLKILILGREFDFH